MKLLNNFSKKKHGDMKCFFNFERCKSSCVNNNFPLMDKIRNVKTNWITIVVVAIVCFFVLINSSALDNSGLAAVAIMWQPIMIGIITLIIYFIAKLFSKKYAWMVTLFGLIVNIFALLNFLLN